MLHRLKGCSFLTWLILAREVDFGAALTLADVVRE
jgi:hypothetical protein